MRDFTLYLDETGDFVHPRDQAAATGLRMVGGLLLAGHPDELDASLKPRVRAAFGAWRGAWHATELRNPFKRAAHLLDVDPAHLPQTLHPALSRLAASPRRLLAVCLKRRENRALESWAQHECDLTFQRLAAVVQDAVGAEAHARLLATIEHDTFPTVSRYPDMLTATLQYALWSLGVGDGDVRLHVLAEERNDLRVLPNQGALYAAAEAARDRRRAAGEPSGRRVEFAEAHPRIVKGTDECAGLVLADVLLYHLREVGRLPSVGLSARDLELFDREGFRELLASDLGVDLPAPLIGATGAPLTILREVERGALSFTEARARLRPDMIPLNDGLVRASWETALALLDSWEQRR